MATGTDSADLPPSSGGSDLEEGEFVPEYGDSVGPNHEDGKFVPEHDDWAASDAESGHDGDGRPGIKRPRLEFEGIVVDGGALSSPSPSPTPSRDRDSYGTISYVDASLASLGLKPLVFTCAVCRREFTTQRGLSIHINVHGPHECQQCYKEWTPAIGGGLAVAGETSSVGRRSVFFPRGEGGVVDSMAMVVPEPVIDPMPIALASSSSSSAEPSPRNDDSMAIPVSSQDIPTSQVVVHPPCSSQFLQGHQRAAPQVVLAQAPPSVAQGQQLAEAAAAPSQFVVHQPAARQVVARQVQRILPPPPPALTEPGRWVRKEKECDQRRFATDQGLGGPMSGNKRQRNEAADWGLDLHLGVGYPAKLHPCKYCTGVFTSGAQLSGHMRKHYAPQKLASALELSLSMPSAAMEATPAQRPVVEPSPPPDVLRIFGVDMVVPPGATANGTSSVVT
nr:uncharacterized protein LOC127320702 isoform X1 [Lolium perenne]